MVDRRILGVGALAAGAVVMAARARRRALHADRGDDPRWAELQRPVVGRAHTVESFDGTRLHVEVLGPDDAPTAVLAHGYGATQQVWHYQRRDLRTELRLVCYDQRGHGRSAAPPGGDWSVAALGRDLAAVLDACAPADRQAVAVGHSMGAMAILSWVQQFPDLVSRRLSGAVLVDTTGSDVLAAGLLSRGLPGLAALEKRLIRLGFVALDRRPALADRLLGTPTALSFLLTRAVGLGPHAAPAHVAFTERLILDCPGRTKAALGASLTALDLRTAAPRLAVPTLVVVGERDRLTPPWQARVLADALPQGRLAVLPGVGHMTPLEAHAAVSGHVRALAWSVTTAAAGRSGVGPSPGDATGGP